MKWIALIAIGGVAAALPVSSTARSLASGRDGILYRTVRLSQPRKPPELYFVLPSGNGRRLLARGAEQPSWSPDRRRIAFAGGGVVGREGIWVMNADGSGRRRLTRRPGDGDPSWSPDARRIAYRSASATSFDLWVVASTGGTPRPLLRTSQANELEPDWSPDGKRIAFQSTRAGGIQIWVQNLFSKQAHRLTSGSGASAPDWSPDGRRIAFATGGRIAVVDADGRRRRVLPSGTPLSADDPTWSPDGKRIAFQRGGQVLSMSARGGDIRYITRAAWGTNTDPDW